MNEEKNQERLHAYIEGSVQGVGFRFFVIQCAEELGLTGWVRNLWDSRVEVTAEGPRDSLEILLKYLQEGPRNASVSRVSTEWQPATYEFTNFNVLSNTY